VERHGVVITIEDILRPEQIDLDLKTANQEEAIHHVASLLREDGRVTDWAAFYEGLLTKQPCLAAAGGTEICIPHTRTDNVTGMVMSAGRSQKGIVVPGEKWPIHFIFVIGVPVALAADYLRIIGAMTRIFRDASTKERLRRAKKPEEFLRLLASAEMKL
jgi:mannitol/fructose-specific phosphotransferase system IIA component (Ntr-type)